MPLTLAPKTNHATRVSDVEMLELRRSTACMVVLDRMLRVVSADAQAYELLAEFDPDGCLPADLDRDLASWVGAGTPGAQATFVTTEGLFARAMILEGEAPAIGLFLERVRLRESLDDAALRYSLSGRERQVVRSILDGSSSGEISLELGISEHTVGDYLKRIFAKTGARSRSELVAKVLGWRAGARRPSLRRIAQ
jgi:DNA-binding CsgD family transcriptional regulator